MDVEWMVVFIIWSKSQLAIQWLDRMVVLTVVGSSYPPQDLIGNQWLIRIKIKMITCYEALYINFIHRLLLGSEEEALMSTKSRLSKWLSLPWCLLIVFCPWPYTFSFNTNAKVMSLEMHEQHNALGILNTCIHHILFNLFHNIELYT